ncbi:MAG: TRAP transporter substrate-binding protein DctP [Hyphomicrobiaceae bacterium]
MIMTLMRVVSLSLAVTICAASPLLAAPNDPLNLRITLQVPITNHLGQNLVAFKQRIESQSEGRIKVDIFDKAQLFKDFEVIDAVGSGKIEMGVVPLNQYRNLVPVVDILGLPFMFTQDALIRKATAPDHDIRRAIDKGISQKTNTVALWWQPYGNSVAFSTGMTPINTPDEISGKRIRVFSELEGEFITACGGTPFRIPGSQQTQAMRDRVVDIGLTGITGVNTRALWEVSSTITKTNHGAIEFLVVMNADLWAGLSEADRDLIRRIGNEVELELRDEFQKIEDDAYAFAQDKKMPIFDITPNDLAEWRACSVDLVNQFLSRAGEAGFDLMAAYGRLMMDPCCSGGASGVFTRH